eukprot:6363804-Prorocentrum_lima.AAC.1
MKHFEGKAGTIAGETRAGIALDHSASSGIATRAVGEGIARHESLAREFESDMREALERSR